MLSKNQIADVKALHQKKQRQSQKRFIVETPKIVREFLESAYIFEKIYATKDFIDEAEAIPPKLQEITLEELQKISLLQTPQSVLAIVQTPDFDIKDFPNQGQFWLLDNIQDPGNLGAIIRIADWFDMPHIVCSKNSVDAYNPKVVQASMGSLARVKVYYTDLEVFLKAKREIFTIYKTAAAKGKDQRSLMPQINANSLLILGNEGHGIHPQIEALAHKTLSIPKWGKAESLNAAVAAGIISAKLRGV